MRNLVVSEFLTLDGLMQEPGWSLAYWNDEIAKFKYDELFASDALLLGRVTYQGFAAAWPGRTDEQGYAQRINSLPKWVVSTTLTELSWDNSRLVRGELVKEIQWIKDQPGGDLLVFGSRTLVVALMRENLVDVYNLLVYPIITGSGGRLFDGAPKTELKLVESRSFSTGAVLLRYQKSK